MADAKKCDRCGAFYTVRYMKPTGALKLQELRDTPRAFYRIDLCETCEKQLLDWLNTPFRKEHENGNP